RRPEHDSDAGQDDRRSDEVKAIRHPAIDTPAPQNGENDKNAPIGCVNASKLAFRLESRDDAIEEEQYPAGKPTLPGTPDAQPWPNQPTAANLSKSGKDEEHNCIDNGLHRKIGLLSQETP